MTIQTVRYFLILCLTHFVIPVYAGSTAFIANTVDDTVSIVNTTTRTVVTNVPVGNGPVGVAVHPQGELAYSVNQLEDTVSVIDTSTNTVSATIPVGDAPYAIAIHPSGMFAYVSHSLLPFQNVTVIDTSSNTVLTTLTAGAGPAGIIVNPQGNHIYVANGLGSSLSVFDAATHARLGDIPLSGCPFDLAVNSQGTKLYITDGYSIIDPIFCGTSLWNIDLVAMTINSVEMGQQGAGVAYDDATKTVFVANFFDDSVSVINAGTLTLAGKIPVGRSPFGMAADPAGNNVYVTNTSDDSLTAIDTLSRNVLVTIQVGDQPWTLGDFVGTVKEAAGGNVTGVIANVFSCINVTTGERITVPSDGSTDWNCEEEGLAVSPGDTIRMFVGGIAE